MIAALQEDVLFLLLPGNDFFVIEPEGLGAAQDPYLFGIGEIPESGGNAQSFQNGSRHD